MAKIVWADPAIQDLDTIAEYIALDKPDAARKLVGRVFAAVERLARFPKLGRPPGELRGLPYRELVVPPCRIFYRVEGQVIYVVHVSRAEQRVLPEWFR